MTYNYTFNFVRDKSETGEFFLEISSSGNGPGMRTRKRIAIIDIDSIEPLQGLKFKLTYHTRPTIYDKLSMMRDKTLRQEVY